MTNNDNDTKIIGVHVELINILETLRNKLSEYSDGCLNNNLSYKDLSLILANKINKHGGIIKAF